MEAGRARGGATGRTAIVVDEALGAGHAANAVAVVAISLSALVPGLPGEDVVDLDGTVYAGLITSGVAILQATRAQLKALDEQARARTEIVVVGFPHHGQQTTDYAEYRRRIAATAAAEIQHLAIGLHGSRRQIDKLVGQFRLHR